MIDVKKLRNVYFADRSFLQEVWDSFVMSLPERKKAISKHFAMRNYKELHKALRTLRGPTGNFECPALLQQIDELDSLLTNEEDGKFQKKYTIFLNSLDQFSHDMNEILKSPTSIF